MPSTPVPESSARVVLHGIANCDTVKRARDWLDGSGIAYRFHDFRRHGVGADDLAEWMSDLGWERLLNRQGTTWRKLDEPTRASIRDAASAAELMRAMPAVIRRPVVCWADGEVTVGFDPALFAHRAAA